MTFTVEVQGNCTEVTIMDMNGTDKDVRVMIQDDNKVYIQQYCPSSNRVDVIDMDWPMLCYANYMLL